MQSKIKENLLKNQSFVYKSKLKISFHLNLINTKRICTIHKAKSKIKFKNMSQSLDLTTNNHFLGS